MTGVLGPRKTEWHAVGCSFVADTHLHLQRQCSTICKVPCAQRSREPNARAAAASGTTLHCALLGSAHACAAGFTAQQLLSRRGGREPNQPACGIACMAIWPVAKPAQRCGHSYAGCMCAAICVSPHRVNGMRSSADDGRPKMSPAASSARSTVRFLSSSSTELSASARCSATCMASRT
jgi:hypothetical protein